MNDWYWSGAWQIYKIPKNHEFAIPAGMVNCEYMKKPCFEKQKPRNLFAPASGSAAGQHQSALFYREADFIGFHMAAELFHDGGVDHVGEHSRLQAGGVGIDQEE